MAAASPSWIHRETDSARVVGSSIRMMRQRIKRRLGWYKSRFQVNNPVVGRAVELLGNRVRIDGLTYSVDCPYIGTGHKSTLAFGLHEVEERALARRWLPGDVPVIEIGGGLGVVSCLINRKLQRPRDHVVVEANPVMVEILERNRDINGCGFRVINKALAYDCDAIDLSLDGEFVGSTIFGNAGRTLRVPATTISEILDHAGFECCGIVCDIEGAEADLIQRELTALRDRIQFFMAEMHPAILGAEAVNRLERDVESLGFRLFEKDGDSVFYGR